MSNHKSTESAIKNLEIRVGQLAIQVGGCSIYGGAHESGCCIPQDDVAKEVICMGNQNRQGFHLGGFSIYIK